MEQEIEIQEDVPLAPFTTLKIGGAARLFVRAESEDDVIAALQIAAGNSLPVFILGGGSNVLISDEGFNGLVIQIALPGISRVDERDGLVWATVGAGVDWDDFVADCVSRDLQGVECLSGIPGLVGGTPVQNVGAYGQEVSETICTVRCFDRYNANIVELENSDCGFAYRKSIFNTVQKERYIVLSVTYVLRAGGEPKIAYADLESFFGAHRPTLAETRDAVLKLRADKSMVVDERDINTRSAGSFFKNPFVSRREFREIELRAKELSIVPEDEVLPGFPSGKTNMKIPAAWLIEKAGFGKGLVRGNVGLSARHTLALINRGGGTASEILALKNEIEHKVYTTFGVRLVSEPEFVGFA